MTVKVNTKLVQLPTVELMDLSYLSNITDFPIDRPGTLIVTSTAMLLVDSTANSTLISGTAISRPEFTSAVVDEAGTTILVTFNKPVAVFGFGDYKDGFTLSVDGEILEIDSGEHGAEDGEVLLHVSGIAQDQVVKLSFATSLGYIGFPFIGVKPESFTYQDVTNNSIQAFPTLSSATINSAGTLLTMVFSENITSTDDIETGFTVNRNGVAVVISSPSLTDDTIEFTVPEILPTDTVTVSYLGSTKNIESADDGVLLQSFTNHAVTNNAVAPAITGAEIGAVDPSTLVMTFSRAMESASDDITLGMSVTVNGTPRTFTDPATSDSTHIKLHLDTPVISTDTVLVSYNATPGDLQSPGGAQVPSFTNHAVTNTAPSAPAFASAEVGNVNASRVVITFNHAVNSPGLDFLAGISVKVNTIAATFTDPGNVIGTTVQLTLDTPVVNGDTVTVSYNSGPGDLQSAGLVQVASFTDQAVTNNVAP